MAFALCFARASFSSGSCLWALRRLKPLAASCMAAPVQRRAIEGERQNFTLRQTRRTVPMRFSMMLVQARERRSSAGRPSRVTTSPVAGLTALIMSAAVISSTTPASAVMRSAGGFGGGFHPGFAGGFHPGFHPGFVGVRSGSHHRFSHQRFFFVNGVWVNGWAGGYGNACWDYRPVYDAWGNLFGQQYINLCQY